MEIVKGRFLEGEKVTVKIDGIEVTRKVKYNRADGLYIIYKNRKYFEYELQNVYFIVSDTVAESENNMKTNLEGIKRVRFNDFSEYESGNSNNGGCYGFWTDYNRLENGLFEVSYGTTADFNFCPVCGSFNDHYVGEDDIEYSCGEFETVTEAELLKLINCFEETDDCYVEYKQQIKLLLYLDGEE